MICTSVDVQVPTNDDMSRVSRGHFGQQLFGRRSAGVDRGSQGNRRVIENQQAWLGFACQLGQLLGRRMVLRRVGLEVGPFRQPRQGLDFVNQDVAAVAGGERGPGRGGGGRYDDAAGGGGGS